jgi:putative two-component system response regulator
MLRASRMPKITDAHILVVDDHPANVALLEQLLERWGYDNVVATTDSSLVVGLCREARPDLLLLDLHMPDPDGFQILEALGDLTEGESGLPILVLTADMAPATRQRALSLGARDFLTKPFDPTEVQLRVAGLLEMRPLHLRQ